VNHLRGRSAPEKFEKGVEMTAPKLADGDRRAQRQRHAAWISSDISAGIEHCTLGEM
jgi:hypothetical protein